MASVCQELRSKDFGDGAEAIHWVMNLVLAEDLLEVAGAIARWEGQWKEVGRTGCVRLPNMVKMAAVTE